MAASLPLLGIAVAVPLAQAQTAPARGPQVDLGDGVLVPYIVVPPVDMFVPMRLTAEQREQLQAFGETITEDQLRSGESLTGPLERHKVFPPMVVQMLAVGEDTGSLDAMLHKISDFYEQEVEATTEALTSLIEPLMIAVLGGLIAPCGNRTGLQTTW